MASTKSVLNKLPKKVALVVMVIVIVAAIALAAFYFAAPDKFRATFPFFFDDGTPSGNDTPPLARGDGELQVHFIDVGQGDCILILFPDGKNMIIDGGDTDSKYATAITTAMDDLGIKKLDYVLLTHTDADHCGSLDNAIEHAEEVENIYAPKIKSKDYDLGLGDDYGTKDTNVYNNFQAAAAAASYKDSTGNIQAANYIFTEDIITLESEDGTYRMTMFCRDDEYYRQAKVGNSGWLNDVSPICILEYNGRSFVFTGDANNSTGDFKSTSSEKNFLEEIKTTPLSNEFDADVLKVPHHGSDGSSGTDFLSYIKCEYAVVCVGDDSGNKSSGEYDLYISQELDNIDANLEEFAGNGAYDHPHRDVTGDGQRLESSGVQEVYYTLLNGTIICTVDKDGALNFTCDKTATANDGVVIFIENEATSATIIQYEFQIMCLIKEN